MPSVYQHESPEPLSKPCHSTTATAGEAMEVRVSVAAWKAGRSPLGRAGHEEQGVPAVTGKSRAYVTVTEAAGKKSVSQSEDSAFSGTLLKPALRA